MHVCLYTYVYIYIYIYMFTYMCIHMYTCTHIPKTNGSQRRGRGLGRLEASDPCRKLPGKGLLQNNIIIYTSYYSVSYIHTYIHTLA